MGDCPFCRITRGEEVAQIIYEDEQVVAFLDARPIRPGHSLVVPRGHVRAFYELDEVVAYAMWRVVREVARRIAERLRPEQVGLVAAGWDVAHAHMHVIPMLHYHDITSKRLLDGQVVPATSEELRRYSSMLRDDADPPPRASRP
jgi:histidine triad (HIT) family protein